MSQQTTRAANLRHAYDQINTNLVNLSTLNRNIIARIMHHNASLPLTTIQQLFDSYRLNMQLCAEYNAQIQTILNAILHDQDFVAHTDPAAPTAPASEQTALATLAAAAPAAAPINVTTTFYRRTADGRDVQITAEEYARLSAQRNGAGAQATTPSPALTMMDALVMAMREFAEESAAEQEGATDAQIAQATHTGRYDEIENPYSGECAITHEPFAPDSDVTVINHCRHVFMRDGLADWFRRDSRCPVCRYDIGGGSGGGRSSNRNNALENVLSGLTLNTGDNITVRSFTSGRRRDSSA